MNIAIDYDGTMKRSSQFDLHECDMWGDIINAFILAGHRPHIVTMRLGSDEDVREIERFLSLAGVADLEIAVPIIFCGEKGLKRAVCKEQGISIDVWIDDMPDMIGSLPMIGVKS